MTRRRVALVLLTASLLAVALAAPLPQTALSALRLRIVDPLYSVPMPVLAGGHFVAKVLAEASVGVEGAWLLAPGSNVTLTLVSTATEGSYLLLNFSVPADTASGLYDLYVRCGGELLASPRSVWVLSEWPSELVFLHFTDIHIDIKVDGRSSSRYEAAIMLLNNLPVMFAVITGDDVDVGSDVPALRLFREITNRARKPTFIIPGNHDHAQTDEASFRERYYGVYIGPATWYRVIGRFLLVGLDTGLEGFLDSAQLRWLEGVLSEHRDKVKVLLMHHPLFNYATFGRVRGSWREVEKIRNVYSSWRDHMDSAKELLRLIEEYNVTLVLAGHVHGDATVLYNDRTWFVTTTTTCAGIRSGDYRGFRIIRLSDRGEVLQLGVPGKNPLAGFSSFNIDLLKVAYVSDPQLKACTVKVSVAPGFELAIENLTVCYYVNGSVPASEYELYGDVDRVLGREVLSYGALHLVRAVVRVKPGEEFKLTAACYEDETPPEVSIMMYTPRRPVSGKDSVMVYIKAVDEGYGVESVKLVYETPAGAREVRAEHVRGSTYQARIPPLRAKEVKLKAVATDFAGNVGESAELVVSYVVPEVRVPKLAVSVECEREVEVGREFKLTVRVSNEGNGTARSVVAELSAPEGIEPRSASQRWPSLEAGRSVAHEFKLRATREGAYEIKVIVRAANHKAVEEVVKVTAKRPAGVEAYLPYLVVVAVAAVIVAVIAARRRRA